MIFNFEERLSDSPYIDVVWRNHSEQGGPFVSMATGHWQMVVSHVADRTSLIMRGPETKATPAYCPPGAEHFGIYFKIGTVMPHLPTIRLTDGMLEFPEAGSDIFWLYGAAWQYPSYENAETFVDWLVRRELLVQEPVVESTLHPGRQVLSERSVQRRFLRATGLTRGALSQIERARQATNLLQKGVSILDTVALAGYADQPHLTRSLKRFIGKTPAQLNPRFEAEQLSFLSRLRQYSSNY